TSSPAVCKPVGCSWKGASCGLSEHKKNECTDQPVVGEDPSTFVSTALAIGDNPNTIAKSKTVWEGEKKNQLSRKFGWRIYSPVSHLDRYELDLVGVVLHDLQEEVHVLRDSREVPGQEAVEAEAADSMDAHGRRAVLD